MFRYITPSAPIQSFVECYWIIENNDPTPVCQKIIPDGYTEIIVHYGDPYKISLTGNWELQADFLLAGQLTKFFFLENTGKSGIVGIKLKPTALSQLFGFPMKRYTDQVVPAQGISAELDRIREIVNHREDHEIIAHELNRFFEALISGKKDTATFLDDAVNLIFEKKGMVSTRELAAVTFLSERQFLNQFNQQVGLPPKLLARIVRLNYIFQLVKDKKEKWSSLAYEAAYFDQSHFIKEFKEFTGESPNKYAFEDKTLANFFLMTDRNNSI